MFDQSVARCRDFESVTLMKMRQQAERARIIAEMEAQEREGVT